MQVLAKEGIVISGTVGKNGGIEQLSTAGALPGIE